MNSPIYNRIGAVLVPVGNMARAMEWYGRLLDLTIEAVPEGTEVYSLEMNGEITLILRVTSGEWQPSSQPLLFFWTFDLQLARAFLEANGVEIVGEPEDIGSVACLTFKDPDNNLLMVGEAYK